MTNAQPAPGQDPNATGTFVTVILTILRQFTAFLATSSHKSDPRIERIEAILREIETLTQLLEQSFPQHPATPTPQTRLCPPSRKPLPMQARLHAAFRTIHRAAQLPRPAHHLNL